VDLGSAIEICPGCPAFFVLIEGPLSGKTLPDSPPLGHRAW